MRYNRQNDCIEMSVAELCALANRRGEPQCTPPATAVAPGTANS